MWTYQLLSAVVKALAEKLRSDSQYSNLSAETMLFDGPSGRLTSLLSEVVDEEHLMILTIQRMKEIFCQNVNVSCSLGSQSVP